MKHCRSAVRWGMTIGSLFILTGCWGMLLNTSGYTIVDVTADSAYWGGYEPQTVYELQTDVFLQKERRERPGTILVLSPQSLGTRRGGYWESPPTVGAYLADPKKWPEVQQIIWKGTMIRVTSVEFWKDPVGGTVAVKGEILADRFKGKTVYLSDLSSHEVSKEKQEVFLEYPADELLRKRAE